MVETKRTIIIRYSVFTYYFGYILQENLFRNWKDDLYTGAQITRGQSQLLILSFMLRYSLPDLALVDLLQLLNLHMPVSCISSSSYLFRKAFGKPEDSMDFKCMCMNDQCGNIVESNEQKGICVECNSPYDKSICMKEGMFFIVLSIEEQLRCILEHQDEDCFVERGMLGQNTNMHDIVDGDYYRSVNELSNVNHVSLTFNCDGIPVFESSNNSLWPIQLTVNELKPSIRNKNILLGALWFGKSKPAFFVYFLPFIEEMKRLSSVGMYWTAKYSRKQMLTKVFVIQCSCDSVARCMMQGINQFNGQFGCSWCMHEGTVLEKGKGHVRAYTVEQNVVYPLRRSDDLVQHAAMCVDQNVDHVNGVCIASPLILLHDSGFDMVNSFTVDYMHAVLLGCVRQFCKLWFDTSYHTKPWYIGTQMFLLDRKLLRVRPPSEVRRLPRSLAVRKLWKATEWRNWLLYYSVPVLDGVLSNRYLHHWLLLVYCIYELLKENVSKEQITECERKLQYFVCDVEKLYDPSHMSYNVHQLLHICDTVRRFGPLWCSSNFVFEDYNGKLLQLFSGYVSVPKQIARSFLLLRSMQLLSVGMYNEKSKSDSPAEVLYDKLVGNYPLVKMAEKVEDEVTLLGNPIENRVVTNAEMRMLQPLCPNVELNELSVKFYKRAIINGKAYCIRSYGVGLKTNNYTVITDSNKFGEILHLISVPTNDGIMCAIILSLLDAQPASWKHVLTGTAFRHIYKLDATDTCTACKASDLMQKCVVMNIAGGSMYCALQPNRVEKD